LEPASASVVAGNLVGDAHLATELVAICDRESNCEPVGLHERDQWAGSIMYRKALRVGWLDLRCPFHLGDSTRFSVRGPHGMSAAYTLRFLGACLPPEILDVPIVSALAAALRAQYQCERYGACNRKSRHRLWRGAGNARRVSD
jgi:hypothetical protein